MESLQGFENLHRSVANVPSICRISTMQSLGQEFKLPYILIGTTKLIICQYYSR